MAIRGRVEERNSLLKRNIFPSNSTPLTMILNIYFFPSYYLFMSYLFEFNGSIHANPEFSMLAAIMYAIVFNLIYFRARCFTATYRAINYIPFHRHLITSNAQCKRILEYQIAHPIYMLLPIEISLILFLAYMPYHSYKDVPQRICVSSIYITLEVI